MLKKLFAINAIFLICFTSLSLATIIRPFFAQLRFQSWIGKGRGELDHHYPFKGHSSLKLMGGKTNGSQTVYWVENPTILLKAGSYYILSAWLKWLNVKNTLALYAAIRGGGLKDVEAHVKGSIHQWTKISIFLHPHSDVNPRYFAVRLYGPGTVWIGSLDLEEVDGHEYSRLKMETKALLARLNKKGYEWIADTSRLKPLYGQLTFDRLQVQAWRGNGAGGLVKGARYLGKPIYRIKGGESPDAQTVLWIEKPMVRLLANHYYVMSCWIKASDVQQKLEIYGAIRSGGLRDIVVQTRGSFDWQKRHLLISPVKDAVPKYFAVRLYGPGTVWSTPFQLKEIDKQEFNLILQKEKNIKSKLEKSRVEKVLRRHEATLQLPSINSPEQFRIWANIGEGYPSVPYGWKRVDPPGVKYRVTSLTNRQVPSKNYIFFAYNPFEHVYLETVPRPIDEIHDIKIFTTKGECEPATFSIYTKRPLKGIRIQISDLKSDSGDVLPSTNIDIRTIGFIRKKVGRKGKSYYLLPITLEKGPDFIDSNRSRRYWLTFFIPPEQPPGLYIGSLVFEPENAKSSTLPIRVRVLPFELLDPPVARFMWSPLRTNFKENELKMYKDMALHGMTTMMAQGQLKTRNKSVGPEDIAQIVNMLNRKVSYYLDIGFRDPPIGGIYNHHIIYYWDKKLNWFRFWPITDKLDEEFLATYEKVFLKEGKKRGWPRFLHYVVDEPGGTFPQNIKPSSHYLKLLKETFPELSTFVTIGGGLKQGYDEIGKLSPYLDVTCTNYVTPNVIKRLKDLNSTLWVYNGSSHGYSPKKERFFFGWYVWKVGAKGVGQWTYSWGRSPFKKPFRDGQDYAFETHDGFLPTIGWEAIREGVDDLKYIYTLSQLITYAQNSGIQKAMQVASSAKKILNECTRTININYLRGDDVPQSGLTSISARGLTDLRWKIAKSILDILNALGGKWPAIRNQVAIQPFSFNEPAHTDWTSINNEVDANNNFGRDLLSHYKIRTFFSDWKFEKWKGTGKVSLDKAIRHNGNKTIRLEVKSNGPNDNVVAVLYQPDLVLKKGKSYRLSTWIKTQNTRGYVSIYAAIRSGGIDDLMSTKISGTTEKWRFSYVDFVPNKDVTPKYIAIRLWGKGTAWAEIPQLRPLKDELGVELKRTQIWRDEPVLKAQISLPDNCFSPTTPAEINIFDAQENLVLSSKMPFDKRVASIEIPLHKLNFGKYRLELSYRCNKEVSLKTRKSFALDAGPFFIPSPTKQSAGRKD